MSASSKGMLWTIWRCTLSWIVARRAMAQSPRLALGGVGVERHQALEDTVVHLELDNGPARATPAHDVAVPEEVMQQRAGLDVLNKRQGQDGHCSGSDFWYRSRMSTFVLVVKGP
jgi:hypothetical protein